MRGRKDKGMNSGTKQGTALSDFLAYMIFSLMAVILAMRVYIFSVEDYKELLQFLKYTDYAYHAFEVLKTGLYTNVEATALSGNTLQIEKSAYVPGHKIVLTKRDSRLLFVFEGGQVQEICHGVVDVRMRKLGDIIFIKLDFPGVSYERGFYLAK